MAVENAKNQFLKNRNFFKLYMDNIEAKLHAILESEIFQRHIDEEAYTDPEVEDLFLDIARSDNFIMQLRLINREGEETIRVNRNVCYAVPYLSPYDSLQNKASRYYFKEIMKLKRGEFWLSNLDLNIEHGQIEKPFKPVIRMGTPVYKGHEKIGILVINVFMKKLLDAVSSTTLYNIYIVDKDGYFIQHPKPAYNWSRYLPPHLTLHDFFKDADAILNNSEYTSDDFYSARLNIQNPDGLIMIVQPTDAFIRSSKKNFEDEFIFILLLLFLVSIPVSYIFAKPYIKLQNNLNYMNHNLEESVAQKTKELQQLNASLENKIEERTKEQNVLLSLFDLGDAVLFKWRNDENWSVEYVSRSVEKLLGYTPKEFIEGSIQYAQCIHPDDLPRVIKEVEDAVSKKLYFFTHEPYRVITKDKSIKWIHDSTVIVRDENKEVINFVGYLTDITELKESEIKLQLLSTTDTLTHIHNRFFLDEILHKQYYRLLRNNERCSIIMMDIDHFKNINDKFGHLRGDEILKELTRKISTHIRESDVFGRWGGEEFMIIAPHTSLSEAVKLAEKLRHIIEKSTFGEVGKITVSFGVAECTKEKTLDANIMEADKALYNSKAQGRNKVSYA